MYFIKNFIFKLYKIFYNKTIFSYISFPKKAIEYELKPSKFIYHYKQKCTNNLKTKKYNLKIADCLLACWRS